MLQAKLYKPFLPIQQHINPHNTYLDKKRKRKKKKIDLNNTVWHMETTVSKLPQGDSLGLVLLLRPLTLP